MSLRYDPILRRFVFFTPEDNVIDVGDSVEFVNSGNTGIDQDGNYRFIMVGGNLQTQRRIAGVWTALEEI